MLSHEELQQCVETMQEIFYKKMCVFSFSLFPYRNSAHRYHPGNPQQCCIFHFPVDTPSPRQGIHSLRNLKDLLRRKVEIPFANMLQLSFRFAFITFKFLWNEAKYFFPLLNMTIIASQEASLSHQVNRLIKIYSQRS